MTSNEKLYEETLEIIQKLYSDRSVSQEKCRENMQELIDEIKCMIDALGEIG